MRRWFQNLKISQKLALISILFVMPDSVMLYLFITSINANIQFAREPFDAHVFCPLTT